jgi:Flagellar hook-length control protein FliK
MKSAAMPVSFLSLELKALAPHALRGEGEKQMQDGSENAGAAGPPSKDFTTLLDALGQQRPATTTELPAMPPAQGMKPQDNQSSALPAIALEASADFATSRWKQPEPLPSKAPISICAPEADAEIRVVMPAISRNKEKSDPQSPSPQPPTEIEDGDTESPKGTEALALTEDQPVEMAEPPERRTAAIELCIPALLALPIATVPKPQIQSPDRQMRDELLATPGRDEPETISEGMPSRGRAGLQQLAESREVNRATGVDAKAERETMQIFQPADIQGTLTVVRSETSLAPSQPPAQQIFTGIIRAAPPPPKASAVSTARSQVEVVRSIQVSLRPENLGRVTIELRLRGGSIELKVDVETAAARAELSRDEGVLRDMLSDAGYALSDTPILMRVVASEANAAVRQDMNAAAQERPSHSEAQPRDDQRGQQRGTRDDRTTPGENSDARDGEARRIALGDGVYL